MRHLFLSPDHLVALCVVAVVLLVVLLLPLAEAKIIRPLFLSPALTVAATVVAVAAVAADPSSACICCNHCPGQAGHGW